MSQGPLAQAGLHVVGPPHELLLVELVDVLLLVDPPPLVELLEVLDVLALGELLSVVALVEVLRVELGLELLLVAPEPESAVLPPAVLEEPLEVPVVTRELDPGREDPPSAAPIPGATLPPQAAIPNDTRSR
jgi:hypothetical protein